jgi:hypothetical protein
MIERPKAYNSLIEALVAAVRTTCDLETAVRNSVGGNESDVSDVR